MNRENFNKVNPAVFQRFPVNCDNNESQSEQSNPGILLYGRRFYKDQTLVEYLSEFLLAFASPKKENGDNVYQFEVGENSKNDPCAYWPENRVALKLFSFFPSSKLETRHRVHRTAYFEALESISNKISGNSEERDETIRLIQSLFGGFIGVAKNRTWATYSFLPASTSLLSHEVGWEHEKALKNDSLIVDWKSSRPYFGRFRNFMARGGEVLFLQLANLFAQPDNYFIKEMTSVDEYHYLDDRFNGLQNRIETGLRTMLEESLGQIGRLVGFVEGALTDYKIEFTSKSLVFGWIPVASRTESFLFAVEIDNLCASNVSSLDKLEILQTLCCMHVLRSLFFQARRVDMSEKYTNGFLGNYALIIADPDAKLDSPMRKMAQISFGIIDALLFRSIRSPVLCKSGEKQKEKDLKNGDANTFHLFRKFSKEIGLVIPIKGVGQRFTLNQGLLRFFVAVLVSPGNPIRLTEFYQRVFAHYGIALGGEQLNIALAWSGTETDGSSYAVSSSTAWIEEALQQGGFLVELSDAVSMVKNPG
jgi:hypothetical protein